MVLRPFFLGLAIAAVAGCAIGEQDASVASGPRTLAVEPRVVLDGLPALKNKVLVDQVLFHVPTVTERVQTADGGDRILSDVLASDSRDEGPLFFRYDAASTDGFGDVLGGVRAWQLGRSDGDGQLVFGFEPFAQRDQLSVDEQKTGVDLGELVDHTAVVHGYMLAQADGSLGGLSEGDPDGNPAHPGNGGGNGDGDPDGNPAHGGDNGEGDPDGNPASGTDTGDHGKHVDHGVTERTQSTGALGSYTATPFMLVLDDNFTLAVPVAQLLAQPEAKGEVLPIDLHVAVDRLLDDTTLAAIDREAASTNAGAVVVHGASIRQAVDIDVQSAVAVQVKETVSSGGIRVVGDHH
jgi:hypothetical protein